MKLTLATISNKNFSEAFAKLVQLELSAKDAYSVGKIYRIIAPEAKSCEEKLLGIYKKYGKPEGENWRIEDPEKLKAAEVELKGLLETEIDVPVYPVTLPEGISITARDLILLEPLLKPVEPPAPEVVKA